MKKNIRIILFALLLPLLSNAQGLDDALRFSYFNLEGTARSAAMGNAFGALGGDFTAISINPAGLGLYRSNEFAVTPAFKQQKIQSTYNGNVSNESKFNFSLTNLSYVLPYRNNSDISINLGIGYNRLKDFNDSYNYSTNNATGSFLDFYTESANYFKNIDEDFYSKILWNVNLIYKDGDNYVHDLEKKYGQQQYITIDKQGALHEYSMALGLNFSHNLYLGASLGIVDVFYNENKTFYEADVNNQYKIFNDFSFNQHLRVNGTGYNGKIGVIYKPIHAVRIGAAFHTPTFYVLNELFETSAVANLDLEDGSHFEDESPMNENNYTLSTPFKASFSGAFVLGKRAIISADYEIVDYSSTKLMEDGNSAPFRVENENIGKILGTASNIRVGGEFRANKNISLRAGYERIGSPFKSSEMNADADVNIASAGLGYRKGNMFVDVTYRYKNNILKEFPYPQALDNYYPQVHAADLEYLKHKVLLTIGYRF